MAVVGITLAAATVSAAVLPMTSPNRGLAPSPDSWRAVQGIHAFFPANTQIAAEGVFVIQSAEQLAGFWQAHASAVDPARPGAVAPTVDFSKHILLVVSYGVKHGNYDLRVAHVLTNGERFILAVEHTVPNERGCHYDDGAVFHGTMLLVGRGEVRDPSTATVGVQFSTVSAAPEPSRVHYCYC